MACVLTSDFSLPCRRSKGGIQKVYIAHLSDTAALTVASGAATTFTLSSGKQFFIYELPMGSSQASAVFGGDRAASSRFYTHTVQIQLPKTATATRNEVLILGQATCQIIVLDENGLYSLYGGYRGLEISEGTEQTGTASADLNGYTITFTGDELDLPIEIPSNLISTLTSPA